MNRACFIIPIAQRNIDIHTHPLCTHPLHYLILSFKLTGSRCVILTLICTLEHKPELFSQ